TYGAPGDWYYNEVQFENIDLLSVIVFALFNGTVQSFTLGVFFMISGYFTAASCDRKGTGKFLKDRLLRFGIPILFYILFIDSFIEYALSVFVWGKEASLLKFIVVRINTITSQDVGPLWFIVTLLFFSVFYVLWRFTAQSFNIRHRFEWNVPGNAVIALFAFIVGIMSFTVRIWLPVFWSFKYFGLQFPHFSQYSCFFIAGIWAYRGNWFEKVTNRSGTLWLITTLSLFLIFPVVMFLSGAPEGDMSIFGGLNWQSFVYSVWEQFMCAGMGVGLTVLFRKKFNYTGRIVGALSASTYTVYIIHAPVLVFLCLTLKNISMYPLLKFILVAPLAVVLCFTLANIIRKLPLARKIL
ncbi:acyltransferase family protein, partial [Candidatus Latescibacterota bacterium]